MTWIQAKQKRHISHGFTIVELLIVIVIIAILAAITIIAYNNAQDRARFSQAQTDLESIQKALGLYKAENDRYPSTINQSGCTNNWCGWDQATGDNFIIGLSPTYIPRIPQMPSSQAANNTYLYQSNGTDYQLIRYNGAGTNEVERSSSLRATGQQYDDVAWGYKTNPTMA